MASLEDVRVVQRIEDKVDRLVEAVAEMRGSLIARVDIHGDQLEDHERRLRVLERFRYAIPSTAFFAVCVSLGSLIYLITHKSPPPHK